MLGTRVFVLLLQVAVVTKLTIMSKGRIAPRCGNSGTVVVSLISARGNAWLSDVEALFSGEMRSWR